MAGKTFESSSRGCLKFEAGRPVVTYVQSRPKERALRAHPRRKQPGQLLLRAAISSFLLEIVALALGYFAMEEEHDSSENRPASRFWELHQRLAECYVQDMAGRTEKRLPDSFQSFVAKRRSSQQAMSPVITERREVNITTLLDSKGKARTETDITLAPLPCWKQHKSEHRTSSNRAVSVDALMSSLPKRSGSFTAGGKDGVGLELPLRGRASSLVLHPGGARRTVWNIAVALGVLHDLIFVPMYVFNLPDTTFFKVMEWVTQIFWNVDLIVSLFTGYYDEGMLVLELKKTVMNYAKTWMIFDVCLITLDWSIVWIDTLGADQGDFVQWSRTISMLRILRLLRMLRWVKLRRVNDA